MKKEMTNKTEWEKEFDGIAPKIDWRGFPSRDVIKSFIHQQIAKTRQETIDEVAKIIDEYLRQWLISFANRPLEKREDTFKEVFKIRNEIQQNLAKLHFKITN